MKKFIHIKSKKFPILKGEKEELVNEGMYGKALSIYLKKNLSEKGYNSPFYCNEDWGWWVEIKSDLISCGICIYSDSEEKSPENYACCLSIEPGKKWIWKKFKFIDTTDFFEKIMKDMENIFHSDKEIEVVKISDDFPL